MYFTAPTYTETTLKAEYKLLCKKFHPDKKGGNEKSFKEMKAEHDMIEQAILFSTQGIWIKPTPPPKVVPVSNRSAYPQKKSALGEVIDAFINMTPEQLEAVQSLFKIIIKPKKKK